ncbi:MAG: fatty acid desaturase [Holophagales bacterium]|nr:fatty acid desaturase [Holophagales bacterium]
MQAETHPPIVKKKFYYHHIGDLKQRLAAEIPRQELRELHRIRAWRHFAVAARHAALFLLCGWALFQSHYPWLWPIAAVLQGFNILGFLILVHEQVHKAIFAKSKPRLERLLGLLYALPTGISVSQFTRWHLDHHDELGHAEHDPKRAHLSPKKNSRWLKLLYLTPALFVIYSRASRKEAASYPADLRATIRNERLLTAAFHLSAMAALFYFGGGWVLLRVHVIPLFFCFPPIFVLNRLGQHYDIDVSDPAKWSTRVDGNPIWRTLFLWSNLHAEHHFYQRIPFYNLTRLNRRLRGFYESIGMPNRTYGRMLYGWLVQNKEAHTDWKA